MKKRLLLTLLPLAFLVAACSGANRPASSSSAAQSSSAAGTSSAAGDTSSAEESSSEAEPDDRGQDAPAAEGLSIKVGDLYFELSAEAESLYEATYSIEDLDLEAGDIVIPYKDGEAIGVWAEGDENNIPNYDERKGGSEQFESVTVTNTGCWNIYLNEYQDGSYGIWITGGGSGGEGGEGGEGGQTTGEKYTILVDDTEVEVTHNTSPLDPSFDEYYALDVAVQ